MKLGRRSLFAAAFFASVLIVMPDITYAQTKRSSFFGRYFKTAPTIVSQPVISTVNLGVIGDDATGFTVFKILDSTNLSQIRLTFSSIDGGQSFIATFPANSSFTQVDGKIVAFNPTTNQFTTFSSTDGATIGTAVTDGVTGQVANPVDLVGIAPEPH